MATLHQALINRIEKIEGKINPPKRWFIQLGDEPLPPEAVGDDVEIMQIRFISPPPRP